MSAREVVDGRHLRREHQRVGACARVEDDEAPEDRERRIASAAEQVGGREVGERPALVGFAQGVARDAGQGPAQIDRRRVEYQSLVVPHPCVQRRAGGRALSGGILALGPGGEDPKGEQRRAGRMRPAHCGFSCSTMSVSLSGSPDSSATTAS